MKDSRTFFRVLQESQILHRDDSIVADSQIYPTLTEQPLTDADEPFPPTVRVTLSLRPPSSKGTSKRSSTCNVTQNRGRR